MRCEEFRKRLARWLEDAWDIDTPDGGAVPAELSDHADECPECRARLNTAVSLLKAQDSVTEPSPFLKTAVQEKLTGEKPADRRRGILYASIAAAAAVVLIVTGLMVGFLRDSGGTTGKLLVKFSLEAPGAKRVYVVGDWNEWNPAANPLSDGDSDGVWETEIKLEPGREYRYQFFIDDNEWVPDPKAPLKIDDGFGGKNSILRI